MGVPSIAVRENWGPLVFQSRSPVQGNPATSVHPLTKGGERILAGNILPDETRAKFIIIDLAGSSCAIPVIIAVFLYGYSSFFSTNAAGTMLPFPYRLLMASIA